MPDNHNHHQVMTLVFGAIPPVAMVLALPLLLPSEHAAENKVFANDNCHDEKNKFRWLCFAIGSTCLQNCEEEKNLQGEDEDRKEEGKSKCEIFKAVLRCFCYGGPNLQGFATETIS